MTSSQHQHQKRTVKGWCPGIRKPMPSGDGLLMRLKPDMHRMTSDEVLSLCASAKAHGSGIIALTNRANLQIRGLEEEGYHSLVSELAVAGLISELPEDDEELNLLTSPRFTAGDMTSQLAAELRRRCMELPALPAKFGFSIDLSPQPCLRGCSSDIRLEADGRGGILIRADGAEKARKTTEAEAVSDMIALAHHYAETRRPTQRRMARFVRDDMLDERWQDTECSVPEDVMMTVGPSDQGQIVALPFSQCHAERLADIISASGAEAVRLTPFGMIILEGCTEFTSEEVITQPDSPLLKVRACSGSPYCSSAFINTQDIATRLPELEAETIHISGCAKGCAYPFRADITLVGHPEGLYMISEGYPWDDHIIKDVSLDNLDSLIAGDEEAEEETE